MVPRVQAKKSDTLRVRLDDELRTRLEAVCKETGQTKSAAARFLLVAGLEAHERDRKKR